MRILHGDGFRLREREEARETVISNLVRIHQITFPLINKEHCM